MNWGVKKSLGGGGGLAFSFFRILAENIFLIINVKCIRAVLFAIRTML